MTDPQNPVPMHHHSDGAKGCRSGTWGSALSASETHFSSPRRPDRRRGGHLGLLGDIHLELRRSMRKLPTHCHLAARLRPASRPPLISCHAVARKQKEGKLYFLASLHFSFLSTTLKYISLVSLILN